MIKSLVIFFMLASSATTAFKPSASSIRSLPKLYSVQTGWLHNEDAPPPLPSSFSSRHEIPVLPYIQKLPDLQRSLVTSHTFTCPLDHEAAVSGGDDAADNDDCETVTVHATVVDILPDHVSSPQVIDFLNSHAPGTELAEAYKQMFHDPSKVKSILYLQGGPGFPSPRPNLSLSFTSSSWATSAMKKGFNKFVLMDQRGTGQSTPVTLQSLRLKFGPDLPTSSVSDYLTNFRAPSINLDADLIRRTLLSDSQPYDAILGQSFGGFCLASYLTNPSLLPPKSAFFTGGIPPMYAESPAAAYSKLYERVLERNKLYYSRYPGDVALIKRIVRALSDSPPPLPMGGRLTPKRFLQLGMALGGGPGSFEGLHELLSQAFLPGTSTISVNFLRSVERTQPFDTNPIYALLHESIYLDGPTPSSWAASSALDSSPRLTSLFDYTQTMSPTNPSPVMLYGEMVYPFMFDDYAELKPLKDVANHLAERKDWSSLYVSRVPPSSPPPSAASIYHDDMYVDRNLSFSCLEDGRALEYVKPYVTNEYQHSGLRYAGGDIFDKLMELAKD
mmetsp:Transcript_14947/g.30749  ORF Transcript_14947/g.30749 Transcript_14947/m.30749 type:complete len:559 (+) Transcript_14947:59-1735(+)